MRSLAQVMSAAKEKECMFSVCCLNNSVTKLAVSWPVHHQTSLPDGLQVALLQSPPECAQVIVHVEEAKGEAARHGN